MNDWSGYPRSASQIKRGLELRRSELREDMDLFFRGKRSRAGDVDIESDETAAAAPGTSSLPVLAVVAAGALIGFLVFRRSVWPLRLAGRVIELAAPAMVPVLVQRVLRE